MSNPNNVMKEGISAGLAVASALVFDARNNGVPTEVVADLLMRLLLDTRAVDLIAQNTESYLGDPEQETAKLNKMIRDLMVLASESLEASIRSVNAKHMS